VDNIKVEYLMSKHIKEKFDEKYGTNWHCVVDKNFASYVSYESKNYIFFYEGQLAVLLYKIGWSFWNLFLSFMCQFFYLLNKKKNRFWNWFLGIGKIFPFQKIRKVEKKAIKLKFEIKFL
jgi:hypothetical protein